MLPIFHFKRICLAILRFALGQVFLLILEFALQVFLLVFQLNNF